MERQREERRKQMEEKKVAKKQREMYNEAQGRNVDAEFDVMLDKYKLG